MLPPYQYLAKCRARVLTDRAPLDFYIDGSGLCSCLYLQATRRRGILPLPEKIFIFSEMLSEGFDALVSPRRKEGVKALFNIFFCCHVQAVCDLLDGACNAVVKLVGIMQTRLFASGDLLPQAHIYAADELGLLAVVLLKMRALFIIGGGKIGLDLFCNFVVIKEIFEC